MTSLLYLLCVMISQRSNSMVRSVLEFDCYCHCDGCDVLYILLFCYSSAFWQSKATKIESKSVCAPQ